MGPNKAAEMVGRLNPKCLVFQSSSRTTAVFITPLDVAGGMGMLKVPTDTLFLHVIYGQHQNFSDDLEKALLGKVIDTFHGERWPRHEKGFLTRMIWTALAEFISQPLCPVCNGDKQTIINQEEADTLNKAVINAQFRAGQAIICQGCQGSGYARKTNHWRSKAVGVHHDLFKRSWAEPYGKILNLIRHIDDRAKSSLAARLT